MGKPNNRKLTGVNRVGHLLPRADCQVPNSDKSENGRSNRVDNSDPPISKAKIAPFGIRIEYRCPTTNELVFVRYIP